MAVIVSQIKTPIGSADNDAVRKALKKIGVNEKNVIRAGIYKTSVDARDNNNIKLVSSVKVELCSEKDEAKICERFSFCSLAAKSIVMPDKSVSSDKKVVIAGFGPAGMFAGLVLAEYGFSPVIIERGADVDSRVQIVENFQKNAVLDPNTNIQFGEGGAGTFSDGKLTTRIHDPLCGYVLEKFAEFGAPEEILVRSKPHIGTDKLRNVIKNIREKIIALGGMVRFDSCLADISEKAGKVNSVTLSGGEVIPCDALILAIGHSARDTFEMLLNKKIFLESKPFSIGTRIEHKQEAVDRSLYGKYWNEPALPKGEYQLSFRNGKRAVYTFCMCPGGTVVPAASEMETVVTNGMSVFARDGENANSAVAVSVSPDDYGNSPLDGVEFARKIERRAFVLVGKNYKAPASTVGNFLNGNGGLSGASIVPTYGIGVEECNLNELFPEFITDMLKIGLNDFSRKMECFGDKGAVLTAPETRTSSPVRITRNENMESLSLKGLYPCGEGAGYAGGIMSAAVDGVKCALKIIEN